MAGAPVPAVEVADAVGQLDGGAVFLDVREPDEWQAGHAPDATWIPMGDLRARQGELPADRDIVVVCRSGARSARVTAALLGAGYEARNLTGGMQAWAAAGLPVVTEAGGTGVVV